MVLGFIHSFRCLAPGEVRDLSEFLREHFDFLRRTAILWLQIQVIDSHTRSKGGQEGTFCLLSFFFLKTSTNSFCRMPLGAMIGTQLPGRLGKSISHPCSLYSREWTPPSWKRGLEWSLNRFLNC